MSARFVATTAVNAQTRGVLPLSQGILILGSSGTAVSHTGDTNEFTLATIAVPAGAMGKNGGLRITTYWTLTNSANNKTLRVKFGGTALVAGVLTTSGFLVDQRITYNAGATNSQVTYAASMGQSLQFSSSAYGTAAIDTTAAQNITITGQLASSGETITLTAYSVELIPGVP